VTCGTSPDGQPLPLTDSEFAPYLVETRFITPSLPELGDLTEAICGEETDGWLVTQKILDWVYQNIRTEMIPQTLTTEEILTGRKGKCAEYAILFAAMARAAGLPTKVALGERYQDGVWVGHMWNEVWLGEWVAVDPSHGQSAPDALLLKFVDSPDVMGTQKVRMGLTGKLGIIIEGGNHRRRGRSCSRPANRHSGADLHQCGLPLPADCPRWLPAC